MRIAIAMVLLLTRHIKEEIMLPNFFIILFAVLEY